MFENLNAQLSKLLGKRDDDPQSTITADQLKVVLKSIEGKYNNLKNENKLFKSKIDELKATIAELENTIHELKGGNASAQADSALLTQLEKDLDAARTQLGEQRESYEAARNDKLQLQSKLSVQEALVASLRHEISEMREQQAAGVSPEAHAQSLAEIEKLRGDIASMQQKVQEVAGQLVGAQEQAEEQAKEAEEARSALDAMEKDFHAAREEAKTASKALKKLESEREALMERLEELSEERDEVNQSIEALKADRDGWKTRAVEFEASLLEAREQADTLGQDKAELADKVQVQQAAITSLEEQLAGGGPQAAVVAELEDKLMQARARIEQQGAENQALQERLQAVVDEPAGMSAREKTELEFQIKRLSDELAEAGVQISALREAKVKASLDLEEAASELVELRRQLEDLRRDRNFYRERYEGLREQQGDVEQIKRQMGELLGEIGRLRGEPARPVEPAAGSTRPIGWTTSPAPQAPPPSPAPAQPAPAATAEVSSTALAKRRETLNKLIGNRKNP